MQLTSNVSGTLAGGIAITNDPTIFDESGTNYKECSAYVDGGLGRMNLYISENSNLYADAFRHNVVDIVEHDGYFVIDAPIAGDNKQQYFVVESPTT